MGQIGSRTNRAAVRVTIDALRAAECLRDRDLALVRLVEATATGLDVASGRHLAPYARAAAARAHLAAITVPNGAGGGRRAVQ